MLGFKNFDSASNTIQGLEAIHMIHKGLTLVRNEADEIKLDQQLFDVNLKKGIVFTMPKLLYIFKYLNYLNTTKMSPNYRNHLICSRTIIISY